MVRSILCLVLGFSFFFVSCQGNNSTKTGSTEGTLYRAFAAEPGDINPLSASELISRYVYWKNIIENLMVRDPNTNEWRPYLAERWEVSDDGKEFTFYLRKGVKFHDGSELTAEDVKFSFDAIYDPIYEAYVLRSFYQNINSPTVVDKYTIKFTAKNSYFMNLDILAWMRVLPKSFYSKQTKENRLRKTVVGSGPYKFKKWNKGKSITIEANPDWWGNNDPYFKKKHNFARINFKFVKEAALRRAMLERGKIDFELRIRGEDYEKKMSGGPWGKSVFKKKVENKIPKDLWFIGWNNKNPRFGNKNLRRALAHLINRDFMIEKFLYGMQDKARGPFDNKSVYADPSVKPVEFDPEEAQAIFAKEGWTDSDKNGVLDKVVDGKKLEFSFTLLNANKESEKYFTTIQQDMKKAGVEMKINTVDWNALVKAFDERKFDALTMIWGGGPVDMDPKQIWHSENIVGKGSNFVSYSNPKVDKLIEEARMTPDKQKRIPKMREVYRQIAEDQPYAFLFFKKYDLYAVSGKVKQEQETYNYEIGEDYWWAAAK